MTNHQHSVVTERQRGFLGALLLMLALVVGQFVTMERKISVRSGADPAVTRTAAERSGNRASVPRPLSAGGGAGNSDSWLISGGGDRRVAKARTAGSGGEPSADPAFVISGYAIPVASRSEGPMVVSFANATAAGTPRHHFEGRAPPARLL